MTPAGLGFRYFVVVSLLPTRVLNRLPALRIGLIDNEIAMIEHFSLAKYCFNSTVLRACW